MLRHEASHDEFAVLLGPGVLAITAVELFGHPVGPSTLPDPTWCGCVEGRCALFTD